MSLLGTKPTLQQVCTATLGHATTGDGLVACFAAAGAERFDGSYIGSKDRLSNFGMYGEPSISLDNTTLNWVYNDVTTKTFIPITNHTTWKFTSSCVVTGFTIAVYDNINKNYLGDITGTFPSGSVVRVTPNAVNNTGIDKVCQIYCGTYTGVNISGGECIGTQSHAPVGVIYTWYIGTAESFTISNNTHSMSVGSTYFDLHFDHNFVGDKWIYWSISRTYPNVATLASGAGISPTGIHLKTAITCDKSGTLSEAIADGDQIKITLSLDEA
jgi:hypothetical protein